MAKHLSLLALIVALLAPSTLLGRNRLHTIDELNNTPHTINSHAGVERYSSLEADHTTYRIIPKEELDIKGRPTYPRIKQMSNGKWLLLFQGAQIGSYIYYSISSNLETWSYRKPLFSAYYVEHEQGKDHRRFSTADAVVLQNGDILVACSYRANKGYKSDIDCGIMLRRSSDNGKTWSKEEIIYRGANWEPYLLQLPDGRIHCYFTDSKPAIKNSGTSLIISSDNGKTWSEKQIVCRQHRCTYEDGTRIYTDQMPSFRVLNDGTTLLGFLESNISDIPKGEKSNYRMSVIRQHGLDWRPLKGDEVGPADRDSNVARGAGGYVATFTSGETVLSCNIRNRFSLKVGNHTGTEFNGRSWDSDWLKPLAKGGYWGATERIDDHRLLATMHSEDGIQLVILHLNHRIASPQTTIKVDGKSDDWSNDEALFVGSESESQMAIRSAHDKAYLYLLVECKSEEIDTSAKVRINNLAPIEINVKKCSSRISGLLSRCRKTRTDKGERGFVAEIAVPRSLIIGNEVALHATLTSNGKSDTFSHAREEDSSTWPRISLE